MRDAMEFLGKRYADWRPPYFSISCGEQEYTVSELQSRDMPGCGLFIVSRELGNFYGRPVNARSGRLAVFALESVIQEPEPRQYKEFHGSFEPTFHGGNTNSTFQTLVLPEIEEIVHIAEIRHGSVMLLR